MPPAGAAASPQSKKNQRVQPDRQPRLFRRRDPTRRIAAIRWNRERKKPMKYLTILCLSLGLTGCYSAGPYTGPVMDLSACADSADTRIDPLCHPLTRTQPQAAAYQRQTPDTGLPASR